MFTASVILVVGDPSGHSESIADMLGDRYRIIAVKNIDEAMGYVADGVDLVICDLDSPEVNGLRLLQMWKSRDQRTPFVVLTGGANVSSVVEAMKLGVADCLVRPVNANELRSAASRSLQAHQRAKDEEDSGIASDDENGRPSIDIPPGTSLEDLERVAVEQALSQHQGNRTHAARTLGISVRTLQRKLKAWGLPLNAFQSNGPMNHFLFMEQHESPVGPASFGAHAH